MKKIKLNLKRTISAIGLIISGSLTYIFKSKKIGVGIIAGGMLLLTAEVEENFKPIEKEDE